VATTDPAGAGGPREPRVGARVRGACPRTAAGRIRACSTQRAGAVRAWARVAMACGSSEDSSRSGTWAAMGAPPWRYTLFQTHITCRMSHLGNGVHLNFFRGRESCRVGTAHLALRRGKRWTVPTLLDQLLSNSGSAQLFLSFPSMARGRAIPTIDTSPFERAHSTPKTGTRYYVGSGQQGGHPERGEDDERSDEARRHVRPRLTARRGSSTIDDRTVDRDRFPLTVRDEPFGWKSHGSDALLLRDVKLRAAGRQSGG
jgi:hypothetical protein